MQHTTVDVPLDLSLLWQLNIRQLAKLLELRKAFDDPISWSEDWWEQAGREERDEAWDALYDYVNGLFPNESTDRRADLLWRLKSINERKGL